MMNRHATILASLGGYQRVAQLFGLKVNTVCKWQHRGIPAKHWHRLIALAPELSAEYLERTKPRRRR